MTNLYLDHAGHGGGFGVDKMGDSTGKLELLSLA